MTAQDSPIVPGAGPTALTFMLSWACNARCPHCYVRAEARSGYSGLPSFGSDKMPQEDMPLDTFAQALRRYPSVVGVDLSSLGETLLYPWFREAFALARKQCAAVGVTTNGQLLDQFPEILEVPGWLTVSIDSLKKPRAGLQHMRVWGNLRVLAGMPRHPDRSINLNMVVTADNVAEVPAMIDRAGDLGLKGVSILRAVHLAGTRVATKELPFDHPGVQQAIEAGRQRWPSLLIIDFFRYLDGGDTLADSGVCSWPNQMLLVATDGTARPCCRVQGESLGDFSPESDPWNHPIEQRLRDQCQRHEWTDEFAACRVCYVRNGNGDRHVVARP